MIKRTYARLTRDLIDDESYLTSDPQLSLKDLETLTFVCMQLDSEDPTVFVETDHPDGYNLLIMHPISRQIHWAYSCDFDFVNTNAEA